jgi:hypothetical protein
METTSLVIPILIGNGIYTAYTRMWLRRLGSQQVRRTAFLGGEDDPGMICLRTPSRQSHTVLRNSDDGNNDSILDLKYIKIHLFFSPSPSSSST